MTVPAALFILLIASIIGYYDYQNFTRKDEEK